MIIRYAVEINAGYNPNGQSRRGWYVYTSDGVLLGFLEADGIGDYNLYHMYPGTVIKLHTTRVPVSEWRAAKQGKQISMRFAGFEYGTTTDPDGNRFAWSYNAVRDIGIIWYGGEYAEVTVSGTWKPGRFSWDAYDDAVNMYSGDTGLPLIPFTPEALTEFFINSGQAG